jgi:hypothetical protein
VNNGSLERFILLQRDLSPRPQTLKGGDWSVDGCDGRDLSPCPSLKGRGLVRLQIGVRVQDKVSVAGGLASPLREAPFMVRGDGKGVW